MASENSSEERELREALLKIEQLEAQRAGGATLDADQIAKIARRPDIEQQLAALVIADASHPALPAGGLLPEVAAVSANETAVDPHQGSSASAHVEGVAGTKAWSAWSF